MLDGTAIEASLRSFLGRRPAGVVAAYRFGSVARAADDVNLAVVRGFLVNRLDDPLAFVQTIRAPLT